MWNNYLQPNLRIVVINNGGGGIFRYIPGPSDFDELETYFEASHDLNMKSMAEMYGLDYALASDENSLKQQLDSFFSAGTKAKVLEIKTPAKENANVLRSYFKRIKDEL